jgi:hypothetical protein
MTNEELHTWHAGLRDLQNPQTLAAYIRSGAKETPTKGGKKAPDISEYV